MVVPIEMFLQEHQIFNWVLNEIEFKKSRIKNMPYSSQKTLEKSLRG